MVSLYRRNLPHVRMDNAIYFVTWRLRAGQADLQPLERDVVVNALRHFDGDRHSLHAYVVMNDHVHVLAEPSNAAKLQDIVRSWKSFSAHRMQRSGLRRGAIWQREYFDRVIRDEAEYGEKWNYILDNPFRRWPNLTQYDWSWGLGVD